MRHRNKERLPSTVLTNLFVDCELKKLYIQNVQFETFKSLSWIREESKSMLSEFFTEEENQSESNSVIGKLKSCEEGLQSPDREIRMNSLLTISEIIMVSFHTYIHHRMVKIHALFIKRTYENFNLVDRPLLVRFRDF